MTGDSFARTIAGTAADLPSGHIAVWAEVLSRAHGPDRSVEVALIEARPGHAITIHARRLIDAWRTEAPDLPGPAVALALRSAAQVHQQQTAQRSELVISGPTSPSVSVRLTSSVVVEVIRAARSSLLVVSFAAYGVTAVVDELVAAARRNVHVDLVLESSVEDGGALRGRLGASVAFAALRDLATFWHWPAHRRSTGGTSRPALHAKLIAADDRCVLISSANLTDRALTHNLEVGVVLRNPDLVRKLVAHFTALMRAPAGPLERLR
ncbi:DISARM system phospholipase D-like protein DrmC [Micromonospora matsumotoense]|uniref:DISARM system phospholipase D-like protein DrmC n=1 Tax=Micromonospora matsumotoense TaxID=121616 RepID=UPI0033E7ED78